MLQGNLLDIAIFLADGPEMAQDKLVVSASMGGAECALHLDLISRALIVMWLFQTYTAHSRPSQLPTPNTQTLDAQSKVDGSRHLVRRCRSEQADHFSIRVEAELCLRS